MVGLGNWKTASTFICWHVSKWIAPRWTCLVVENCSERVRWGWFIGFKNVEGHSNRYLSVSVVEETSKLPRRTTQNCVNEAEYYAGCIFNQGKTWYSNTVKSPVPCPIPTALITEWLQAEPRRELIIVLLMDCESAHVRGPRTAPRPTALKGLSLHSYKHRPNIRNTKHCKQLFTPQMFAKSLIQL